MSKSYISMKLRRFVKDRAENKCEYCLIPDYLSFFPHEIDHIIAEKHGGKTEVGNLAYSCWRCNRYKGTDLGSYDPKTGKFSFLYNPRKQKWSDNFEDQKSIIIGLTPEGRTTVSLLQFNTEERLKEHYRRFENKNS